MRLVIVRANASVRARVSAPQKERAETTWLKNFSESGTRRDGCAPILHMKPLPSAHEIDRSIARSSSRKFSFNYEAGAPLIGTSKLNLFIVDFSIGSNGFGDCEILADDWPVTRQMPNRFSLSLSLSFSLSLSLSLSLSRGPSPVTRIRFGIKFHQNLGFIHHSFCISPFFCHNKSSG